MENLTQWIVYGVLFAVLYFVVGYHIAQISRDLRKSWDKSLLGDGPFATAPLKVFLYPMLTAESTKGRPPFWLLKESNYDKPSYVVGHLFFWPLRIIGNLFVLVVLFVIVPIVAFLMSLVLRMVIGAVKAVIGKIKSAEAGS